MPSVLQRRQGVGGRAIKTLIMMPYYNRPILLKRALESILQSHEHHPDWSLLFCDDNSPVPGAPIVLDVLQGFHDRLTLVRNADSIEQRIDQGLTIGKVANEGLLATDAEIAVVLCDDDKLVPTYLRDLSDFYTKNQTVMYAWSKIYVVNLEVSPIHHDFVDYNSWEGAIEPKNRVDSSQVSFRISCFKDYGARYLELGHKHLDADLYSTLYEKFGPAPFTGLTAQFKGIHNYQLLYHKSTLHDFYEDVKQMGGRYF